MLELNEVTEKGEKNMLKVKDVRLTEKQKKDGNGTYCIIEIEFPNGYIWQSPANKGYINNEAKFIIEMSQH